MTWETGRLELASTIILVLQANPLTKCASHPLFYLQIRALQIFAINFGNSSRPKLKIKKYLIIGLAIKTLGLHVLLVGYDRLILVTDLFHLWETAHSTAWKASLFGVFLVCIFRHVFSPNAGKYGPEILRIQTLSAQFSSSLFFLFRLQIQLSCLACFRINPFPGFEAWYFQGVKK